MGGSYVTLPCTPAAQSWATDLAPPDGHPCRNGPAVIQFFQPVIGHPAHDQPVSPTFAAVVVGAADPQEIDAAVPGAIAEVPSFTG